MYTNEIRDIIEEVSAGTSIDTAVQQLVSIKEKLGFDDVVYLILDHPNLNSPAPKTICTYDQSWINHYYDNDFFNADPIVRTSQHHNTPFAWRNIRCTPNEKTFMNVSKEFGIGHNGFSIPIRHGQNEFALLSVSSSGSDSLWADLEQESIPILKMFAHYYHNKFVDYLHTDNAPLPPVTHLTDREKECLLWTARGKNSWEIAQILNISERTVTFHITNVCKKMDVPNKLVAVVQAMKEKLILL